MQFLTVNSRQSVIIPSSPNYLDEPKSQWQTVLQNSHQLTRNQKNLIEVITE